MLNVQEIRDIIKLVDQSSISEFTYETNGSKITMKKPTSMEEVSSSEKMVQTAVSPQIQKETVQQPVLETNKEVRSVTDEKPIEDAKETIQYDAEIVSPMVGTFYRKPAPDSDPYVKLNSKVEESTVVCIVEAMKLFNEIEAETTGEIVEILVEDGELVEYGQPLFRVKKD
ncbi:acetyl-CoA carboxylase biotin carboxyl carrier protein [Virgibacillus sp. W0430]|uniref:acetyl-CoA carboxylase biotin carboxyl carrier protein n=1 Tax=Virgibacillus sp. W0430 TaxID=3391580 RepID=UPI003F480396